MNDAIKLAVWLFVLPAVFLVVVLKVFEFAIGAGA